MVSGSYTTADDRKQAQRNQVWAGVSLFVDYFKGDILCPLFYKLK